VSSAARILSRPRGRGIAIAAAFIGCELLAYPTTCVAQKPGFSFESENDSYPSWGDDDYTNGLRIRLDFDRKLLWSPFSGEDCKEEDNQGACLRTTLMFGQNFYTPQNITVSEVQEDERPYSAWLYVAATAQREAAKRVSTVELHLGTTGKAAFGEEVQTWWHALPLIDAPEPQGWSHQVKPVPGLVGVIGVWDERFPCEWKTADDWVFAQVVPFYRLTGGNVHTHAAAGTTIRFGYNLQRRWAGKLTPTGETSVLDVMSNGHQTKPQQTKPQQPKPQQRDWELNVFTSLEGRAVAWNALLQHDTYTSREFKPINRGVADLEAGVAVGYKRAYFGFRWVFRAPEYDTGRWSKYGGVFFTVASR